ncbi:helix-turn-helix protein [Lutibacter oceani]|uniref:Helix-turn-helix protein n=1 Tax=Lutibacter oceani TaxID=1853311 RepID=A0A3D9RIX6_9FLAO|nr:helix-turn-helix transcriptional regulator [Lutibacter oceani]REE79800.1 helix-turn-helix protein [Lutibacter oceani]
MIKIVALLSTLFINLYGALFLFFTSNKKFKNRFYLGIFFFDSFILFVGHFLSFNEFWNTFRYLDFIFLAALLAFYPLYYLYLNSAFNLIIVKSKWIYHFIPSILIAVAMLITTLFANWEDYQVYMNNNLYSTPLTSNSSLALAYLYKGSRAFHLIQIIIYNFLAIRYIFKTHKEMNNSFSDINKYQLRLFYTANISFILLMSIPGFYVTAIGRTPLNSNEMLLFYVCILFTLLYLILAIIGLKQLPINLQLSQENNTKNLNIHKHDLLEIEKNLIHLFNDKKPWLNPNLNIWDVASSIGTNRSYVSKVINESMGYNFNHFVNNYRVNEAKILLKTKPQLSISEISELSGFGSLNTFIRTFKYFENCTPTEFKLHN